MMPSSVSAVMVSSRGRISLDDERMVARGRERLGQFAEHAFFVVMDFTGFAVKEFWSADNFAAERGADGLVAQADAQNREFAGKFFDQLDRNAGFLRRARPRRNDDLLGLASGDFFDGNFVVAMDFYLATQLAEILGEVVGERVVVVEQQNHFFARLRGTVFGFRSVPLRCAASRAVSKAFDLFTDS